MKLSTVGVIYPLERCVSRSLGWYGWFSERMFPVVTTGSKTHYSAEVCSMWSLPTCTYDHLSRKDCLKLPAAVSLPKSSSLMGTVPVWGGECFPDLSFESHLCDAIVILLLFLNSSELFPCVVEKLLTLAAKDCVSVMNEVCADSLLVKRFGSLPSERFCIRMREAEVWITALPSLAKLPVLRLRGLNSILFQFFSMGLWIAAAIFRWSSYEEVWHIRL